MSASPAVSSTGFDASRGFTKRASRVTSNAALFDLVQDMAAVVDVLPKRLDVIEQKLDVVLEILGKRVDG